jgi:hypothetical protein
MAALVRNLAGKASQHDDRRGDRDEDQKDDNQRSNVKRTHTSLP